MLRAVREFVGRKDHGQVPDGFDEGEYLRLNKDVANAVARRKFKSGADHWLQCGRHEARRMRSPQARSAPPESDIKWIGVAVSEGQTRDCIDPWGFMQVKATGEVLPCCAHPPVGVLSEKVDLEAIVGGKALQALQLGLLVGQLNTYCGRCAIKDPVSVLELRKRYAMHQIEWNKLPVDRTRNLLLDQDNAIPGWLRFVNVEPGRFSFRDTIVLYATDADAPPTVVFENADWSETPVIDIFAIVPDYSGCMNCRVLAGPTIDGMEPVYTATVYRDETLNIVAELPTDLTGGCVAVSVQKHFADDKSAECVVSLTPPVLRKRVAGR